MFGNLFATGYKRPADSLLKQRYEYNPASITKPTVVSGLGNKTKRTQEYSNRYWQ
jgi:hypothetical protein